MSFRHCIVFKVIDINRRFPPTDHKRMGLDSVAEIEVPDAKIHILTWFDNNRMFQRYVDSNDIHLTTVMSSDGADPIKL